MTASQSSPGAYEELELALREVFDDDDALSAAEIVVQKGWRPPLAPQDDSQTASQSEGV